MASSQKKSSKIATYVFFDTETTGLREDGHKPTITEMCFLAVRRSDLNSTEEVQRVVHKLLLCLKPRQEIQKKAKELSGLSDNMLEVESTFDAGLATMIELFLQRLPQPVCLVAHNGNQFHYSLLQAELRRVNASLPPAVLCVDSWEFFTGGTLKPGYKLADIYENCFNRRPVTNRAESDCTNVLAVVKSRDTDFMKWSKLNAKRFQDVEPMY
ncbi:three-prime repair exonuclease 1-like [Gigantopelta aegis]|uniref:three-prime repair exonuclease 1-like n=1 Tax=Gigantopelta aegis TaxID=1735272 RepID=UPI001B888076|nr:three-prime repair exonuclease 1-like [Gigantopelta aegis]